MHQAKIVIGANYGDEGKGLMTRHFVTEAQSILANPIVVFHNGTAQRGHTVDYGPSFRHVYHHFGSGTADKVPTFYAKTFLLHPMEYHREYIELCNQNIRPVTNFCDPEASLITPFDMLVDHATEEYIAILNGEREHGSCGFGSWCATDRMSIYPESKITIGEFAAAAHEYQEVLLKKNYIDCMSILLKRNVDIEKLIDYKTYFFGKDATTKVANIITRYINDVMFFLRTVKLQSFNDIWNRFDYTIFENGQGLGLDMNVDNDWHTTSNTGLINPFKMLEGKEVEAEACYVTRAYLTRHGVGPLEEAVKKAEINETMVDKTNVFNEFQGGLRYGYLGDRDQKARIDKDWAIAAADNRFKKTMAITHTNEFEDSKSNSEYVSDNPYNVVKRA